MRLESIGDDDVLVGPGQTTFANENLSISLETPKYPDRVFETFRGPISFRMNEETWIEMYPKDYETIERRSLLHLPK